MATHYKGQRIDELLGEIATLQEKLNQNQHLLADDSQLNQYSKVYTTLILTRAKLTALQGEK